MDFGTFLLVISLVLVAVCALVHLLITIFEAGHGFLVEERRLNPGRTYTTLGSVQLEDGKYAVVVRPANEGEVRVYQMKTVPPDVFTVEIEQTEYEAMQRYKAASGQHLDIKTQDPS